MHSSNCSSSLMVAMMALFMVRFMRSTCPLAWGIAMGMQNCVWQPYTLVIALKNFYSWAAVLIGAVMSLNFEHFSHTLGCCKSAKAYKYFCSSLKFLFLSNVWMIFVSYELLSEGRIGRWENRNVVIRWNFYNFFC